MSGNKIGGKKCAAKNKERHGKDFYARIGAMGGKVSKRGGFAYVGPNGEQFGKALARDAGAKGGRKSRRGPKFLVLDAKPFGEGFNQPGLMDKLKDRIRNAGR